MGVREIVVLADGKEIPLSTDVRTVREALAKVGVTIDEDDLVDPDLWVELADDMVIRVIRVQEEIIVERETVPYRQQTIKSEALPAGERKLVQAGKNGQAEVTYRLSFENGVEVSRSVLRRVVVQEPQDQITAVGVKGLVESVEVPGTIAYFNGGNAWIMRVTSGGRHPVTTRGDLDGHVFALSPDGGHLLYTVPTDTVELDGPLNDLYLLDVAGVGERPIKLPVGDVLWADWAPDGQRVAYSTGLKSGPPGWKAANDLWVVNLLDERGELVRGKPRRVLPPQSASTYSWWGSRYAWSPDGAKIAYARTDQVGYIDLESGRSFPLAPFPPLNTHRDWIWVPELTWSPDSQFIACTIHGPEPGRPDEESQRFEVWAFDLSGVVRARLTEPVGLWSAPRWSPWVAGDSTLAFAAAERPFSSYDSRYMLYLMDRDGSNKRVLFPRAGEPGLSPPIRYEWSPDGQRLVILHAGDLYMLNLVNGQLDQLTGDGQSTQVSWKE